MSTQNEQFDKLEPTPVVILSASEWQDNPVSTMHIAAFLSARRKVLFVETPGGRWPKISELPRLWGRISRLFRPNTVKPKRGLDPQKVQFLSPLAIPQPNIQFFSWLNKFLLGFQVKRKMKQINIQNPIIWAFSPLWLATLDKIPHQKLVFHCVDGLHTYNNRPWFISAFKQLAQRANVVFTPGILLEEELKALNPNTHRIGHGCSQLHLAYFPQASKQAPELLSIPKPRIVYAGCLANWVDYDLLYESALQLPQYSFVLLGYIHALSPLDKVKKLLALPNVFSLGYVNYARLPEFYHASDIGIVPYQAQNEHIRYSTPTKFLDYLAAGLPCVSTRYPAAEEMSEFAGIADSPEQFTQLITTAIESNTEALKQARIEHAKNHSWEKQVLKMEALILHSKGFNNKYNEISL